MYIWVCWHVYFSLLWRWRTAAVLFHLWSHLAHGYINITSSQAITSVYSTLTCISNASPVNPREESLMTWQHKSLAITVLLHDDLFSMQENETEHRSLQNSRNSEIFEIQKQDILESLCVIMHLILQKDDGAKMIYVYVYMWPWTAKAVLRHWVIFVAMAKNTLYGSE